MASAREEYNKEKNRLNRRFKAYEKQATAKKSFSDIVKDVKKPTTKSVERVKNISAKDLQKNFYVEDEQGNKKEFTDYMHEKRSEASKKAWETRKTADQDAFNESVAQGILDLLNQIKAEKRWSSVKAKCDDIYIIIQTKLEDNSEDSVSREIKRSFFQQLDNNSEVIFDLLEQVRFSSRESECNELLSRVIAILKNQIVIATEEAERQSQQPEPQKEEEQEEAERQSQQPEPEPQKEEQEEEEQEEEEEEDEEEEQARIEGGWMQFDDEDGDEFEYLGWG